MRELTKEGEELVAQKEALDRRRASQLRILRGTDTFEKFKELQKKLTQDRAQLVYLEEQRKKLEEVAGIARQVREAERDRGRVIDEMKTMVTKPTVIYEHFRSTFNNYCQRVLNHDGIFFFKVNNSNDFDYSIALSLPGQAGIPSSQSEGTSYKKLICALFDLALLKVYEDAPFFHFVYHDGILEGLDDRKKVALLAVVREQVATEKTQYILSVIDSDIPRDAAGDRIEFPEDETVLRLHDEGAEGRLFKMAEF